MLICILTEHETGNNVCTVFADPTPEGYIWKYQGTAEDVTGIPAGTTIAEAKDMLKKHLPPQKYNYEWAESKITGRKRGRPAKHIKMKDFHVPLPEELYNEMALEAGVRGLSVTAFARNCWREFMRPGTFPRMDLYPERKKHLS